MLTVQVVVSGVLLGGLYACVAIGFSLVWGVTNIINVAHGSLAVMGAYVTWLLTTLVGVDPFMTIPLSAALLFGFGYALQRLLLNRVARRSLLMTLILTFGLNMVLINIFLVLFSADIRSTPVPYAALSWRIGDLRLPITRVAVFVIALLLTLALHLFMNHTRVGQAIRATAQHARSAVMLGIDTRHTYAMAFGVGAAMAGAAGSLIAILYSFSPFTGDSLTMKAFVIVLLGGLGSIQGAIVAGMILGVAENLVAGLLAPEFQDAVSFGLLLAVLVLWPRGLFGKRYLADAKL